MQLGKQLGLKTLAEGIEQHEQFCQLQDEQCDSGQGFMFARPLAASSVADFLAGLPDPQLPRTHNALEHHQLTGGVTRSSVADAPGTGTG